jgi:hypothetical protein
MRFAALDRTCKARSAQRAGPAVVSGQLKIGRLIREPQLRILALTWHCAIDGLRPPGEQGHGAGRLVAALRPHRRRAWADIHGVLRSDAGMFWLLIPGP